MVQRRTAQPCWGNGNITGLGCLLKICLRRGDISGYLKLAVDRAAVSLVGTTGQRIDSGGGQDPVSLNGLVMHDYALVLNAGSSSLKFCVYRRPEVEDWRLETRGQIECIGTSPRMSAQDPGFLDVVVNKSANVTRIYLPPDINSLLSGFAYRRTNHSNMHVRGYKEKGNINTPMELAINNEIDRFTLAIEVIDRTPKLQRIGAHAKEKYRDQQTDCRNYAYEHGIDMPEIAGWRWPY